MRRFVALSLVAFLLIGVLATAAQARAGWRHKIDVAIKGHSFSVVVRVHHRGLYSHAARRRRAPASNLKLILSMALFHKLGSNYRISTLVKARSRGPVIPGNLWILGRGDPSLAKEGKFAASLPFDATRLGDLAHKIKAAGVRAIDGRVMGSTGYFAHDWFALGWKQDFPREEVALPSALTFNGNTASGRHISDPERKAAATLTNKLKRLGISVRHAAGAGTPPGELKEIARVRAEPLWKLVRYMDRQSSNFFAEVLGKRLAVERYGPPGTIVNAGRAIAAWAARHGVTIRAHDASGLSYLDRLTAKGIVRLLHVAQQDPWGPTLRRSLPSGDEGTLDHRLAGVPVRAKTGTLDGISALSGWVWLRRGGGWARFSILDHGMSKDGAASIEGTIVRTIWRHAR